MYSCCWRYLSGAKTLSGNARIVAPDFYLLSLRQSLNGASCSRKTSQQAGRWASGCRGQRRVPCLHHGHPDVHRQRRHAQTEGPQVKNFLFQVCWRCESSAGFQSERKCPVSMHVWMRLLFIHWWEREVAVKLINVFLISVTTTQQ